MTTKHSRNQWSCLSGHKFAQKKMRTQWAQRNPEGQTMTTSSRTGYSAKSHAHHLKLLCPNTPTTEITPRQDSGTKSTPRHTHTLKKEHFLDTAVSTHPKRTGTSNDGEMQAEKYAAQRTQQPLRVTGSRLTQQHRETTMPTVNPMYGCTATRTQGKTRSNIRSGVSHATGTHTHAQDVNSTCSVPRHNS